MDGTKGGKKLCWEGSCAVTVKEPKGIKFLNS